MTACRNALALLGILIGVLLPAPARAADAEDELKLAFAYNIARFVTWPERDDAQSGETTFRLCVLGRSSYRIANDNLSKRRIDELPIEIVELDPARGEDGKCDLAYLSAEAGEAQALIGDGLPNAVLTVSDAPGFADVGGIIELTRRNDRISMRINVPASRRAGLTISSQLLSLATLVDDESGAGG